MDPSSGIYVINPHKGGTSLSVSAHICMEAADSNVSNRGVVPSVMFLDCCSRGKAKLFSPVPDADLQRAIKFPLTLRSLSWQLPNPTGICYFFVI